MHALPTVTTILAFLAAGLGLVLIPGPNMLYIITRSLAQGRRAGLTSALGVETATLVHIMVAALGISALLLSSTLAFSLVKYGGAIYLVLLGLHTIFMHKQEQTEIRLSESSFLRVFLQGMLVNVLNPKTALFFFAFFPQFLDRTSGNISGQVFFLGALFFLLALCCDCLYALLAGTAGKWVKGNRHMQRLTPIVAGGIYVLLGFLTILLSLGNSRI
ncbi:LysE family translocator [Ktedonosporobacter rubrisoli]|uniref:LysE family translocator n=1 Tax=Ktedonosporobacter rubrisoli TaxID=2509675 RepID=A0A4P6JIJ3_KTERU|nr:LysE family translocator [Ktedonosporobacter rubrisoli]QBD74897.1 LysE family translocator [Ktedonosporobacter rubrisoli]